MVGMDEGRCEGAVLTGRGFAGRVREDPIPSVRFSSASTYQSARSMFSAPRTNEDGRAPEVHGRAEEVVSRRVEVAAYVVPGHGRDDLRL